jgi:hypothetical protein
MSGKGESKRESWRWLEVTIRAVSCAGKPSAEQAVSPVQPMPGFFRKLSLSAEDPDTPAVPPRTISASWAVDTEVVKATQQGCGKEGTARPPSQSSAVAEDAVHALKDAPEHGCGGARGMGGHGRVTLRQRGQGMFAYGIEAEKFATRAETASKSVWLEDVLSLVSTPGACPCQVQIACQPLGWWERVVRS